MKLQGFVAALLCALPLAASPAGGEPPSGQEILAKTIFDEGEIRRVLGGEKVTTPVREVSPREIGIAYACLVPPGRQASLSVLRTDDPLMPEKYRDASGPLDPEQLESGFEALTLGRGAKREAARLLSVEPGYEFNLSTEEMAAFRALEPAKGEAVEAAEAQLRRVLAERVRAYRAGGTAAIAPFARTDDASSSPGDELRRTTEAMHSLRAAFPAFHQALVAYPEGGIEHEEFWFWTRIRVLGRPVFMLHKRIAAKRDEVEMVVERQIYASHFLDVGQTVSATLPVQEGTLLFVVYRSWVDQWTGPGVTVGGKRKVGNELIAAVLRSLVERLRLCEGIAPAAP